MSGPAQLVVALVVGIGGTLYFVRDQRAAPATPTAADVESQFRASHAGTSDADLLSERSRLHEAIARELQALTDARSSNAAPAGGEEPIGASWSSDRVTVVREGADGNVRVVVLESEAPEIFRRQRKHEWLGAMLEQRGAAD